MAINVNEEIWAAFREKNSNPANGKALDWLDEHGVSLFRTESGNYFFWADRDVSFPHGIDKVPKYVERAVSKMLTDENLFAESSFFKMEYDNGEIELMTMREIDDYKHYEKHHGYAPIKPYGNSYIEARCDDRDEVSDEIDRRADYHREKNKNKQSIEIER